MTENYNNPLGNQDSENEENEAEVDIIAQYRKALLGGNSDTGKSKSNMRTKSTKEKVEKKEQTMQKMDLFDSSLYKINVRNGSAWDKDRVNNIIYNPSSNKTKTTAK